MGSHPSASRSWIDNPEILELEDQVEQMLAARERRPIRSREERHGVEEQYQKWKRTWADYWASFRGQTLGQYLGEVVEPTSQSVSALVGLMADMFRTSGLLQIDRTNGRIVAEGVQRILMRVAKHNIHRARVTLLGAQASKRTDPDQLERGRRWLDAIQAEMDEHLRRMGNWERRGRKRELAWLRDDSARKTMLDHVRALGADVQSARDAIRRSRGNKRTAACRAAKELAKKHRLAKAAEDCLASLLLRRTRPRNVALAVTATTFTLASGRAPSVDTLARSLGFK